MFVRFFFLTILCSAGLFSLVAAQDASLVKAEVQKIITHDTEISFDEIPGIIMAIIDREDMYIMGFGQYDSYDQDSLSEALFEIGGLTKVYTAHLTKKILTDLNISSTTPLAELGLDLPASIDEITINQLITHTSGLQNLPSDLADFEEKTHDRYANYSKSDFLNYLSGVEISARKQDKYSHAHTNYALLEIVLERITASTYGELINEYIFQEYQMSSSTFNNSRALQPGYDRASRTTQAWQFSSFAASEGMHTTIKDLAVYLQTNLNPAAGSEFADLLKPQVKIPNAKRSWVADAWHLFRNRKYHNIYLHSGKTTGHGANIQFIPETRTGVIIMVNSPGSLSGLGMLVLRMINDNWKRKTDGEEK